MDRIQNSRNLLNWIKMSLFRNVICKMFTNHMHLIYKSKKDFALNNQKCLIRHETKETYKQ